jgi:hypothetical protein
MLAPGAKEWVQSVTHSRVNIKINNCKCKEIFQQKNSLHHKSKIEEKWFKYLCSLDLELSDSGFML